MPRVAIKKELHVSRTSTRIALSVAAVVTAAASLGVAPGAQADSSVAPAPGAVYVLGNQAAGNAVLVYDRAADGTLSAAGAYPTGGAGTGGGLGSQGALTLSDDGRTLFAANAGSDSVSVFDVRSDGIVLTDVVWSGGVRPDSITVSGRVVYVLNSGTPSTITGFTLEHGQLTPIAGSTRPLSPGASGPAQVQFSPAGDTLAVTERTSSTIDLYSVDRDGVASAPHGYASTGAVPFGFDFDTRGHLITSNAAGSASSYAVDGTALSLITGPVATNQAAPCWLVVSKNGKYAYTANAGAGSISGFAIAQDGSLTLLDPTGVSASIAAGSHPLDETTSGNGRYLYVLADGLHTVAGFRIGDDGSLTKVAAAGTLPVGAAGIAAR
jgi:6-phosphogluconolactonase